VTAHFITEQWVLESYVLETREMPERHTGRIIGLHRVINKLAYKFYKMIQLAWYCTVIL